jgi:hypothetical protein
VALRFVSLQPEAKRVLQLFARRLIANMIVQENTARDVLASLAAMQWNGR